MTRVVHFLAESYDDDEHDVMSWVLAEQTEERSSFSLVLFLATARVGRQRLAALRRNFMVVGFVSLARVVL